SGNSAFFGGGIANWVGGTLNISNSTFSGNSANFGGGIANEGTLNISNSTLANNTGGDCEGPINHTGPNYGCGGSVTGDLNLGPFTNGYFPLLSGSVAIDAGDDSICPSTDQRGAPRPQDGNGDGTA